MIDLAPHAVTRPPTTPSRRQRLPRRPQPDLHRRDLGPQLGDRDRVPFDGRPQGGLGAGRRVLAAQRPQPRADPPDLWATINGSQMLTALKAPGQLDTRWLSEDVPYGLRAWSGLGAALGVRTPVIDAVVALGLTVLSEPMDTNRRTLADLGIDGLTGDEIRAYVAGDPA